MKKWLKALGVVGLMLGGCTFVGEASDKTDSMSFLEVEVYGISDRFGEECNKFFQAMWGEEITENNFRLERLGTITLDTRPHVRPLPAKYLLVLNTKGCVADNPSPKEEHDIVLTESYFASNPDEAQVRWEITRLDPVELERMKELILTESRKKAQLTLQHGEGLSSTTRDCNLWESRESALHKIGYHQDNGYQ